MTSQIRALMIFSLALAGCVNGGLGHRSKGSPSHIQSELSYWNKSSQNSQAQIDPAQGRGTASGEWKAT